RRGRPRLRAHHVHGPERDLRVHLRRLQRHALVRYMHRAADVRRRRPEHMRFRQMQPRHLRVGEGDVRNGLRRLRHRPRVRHLHRARDLRGRRQRERLRKAHAGHSDLRRGHRQHTASGGRRRQALRLASVPRASYGGQFNGTTLGTIPGDYYYPTSDLSQGGPSWPAASNGTQIETALMMPYYLGKGMNTIRLPLRWERLQRSLSTTGASVMTAAQVVATFNATELANLKSSVSALTAAGFTVLVDIHNYATYTSASEISAGQGGDSLGSKNVPNMAFENLWIGLASIWPNNPKVVFDIMNEPNSPADPAG